MFQNNIVYFMLIHKFVLLFHIVFDILPSYKMRAKEFELVKCCGAIPIQK